MALALWVRMRLVALALLVAACGDRPLVSTGSPEVLAPEALTLPPTALGFSRRAALTVSNRSRVPLTFEVHTAPPFSAPTTFSLPAGADEALEVTFTPTALGTTTGSVVIGEWPVALSGDGVAPLECASTSACETSRFDPDTLSCVREPRPDGAACEEPLQCLERGVCHAGMCRGEAARCDDGNACTTDACAVGLGCQHLTTACATPENPCLAARCDPSMGCATAPVQDGTPCGAVSCELANVCLGGSCRAVTPPEGFTCAPASACRGEGVCRSRRCVQPAERPLVPRWTTTASVGDLRFDGVTDDAGHWYWVECSPVLQPQHQPPGHQCVATSRTPEGLERFATPIPATGALQPAWPGTQLVTEGRFVFVTNETTLAAITTSTGALSWTSAVTTLPGPGLRSVRALAEDGRGQLWALVRVQALDSSRDALVRLDARTGQPRGEAVYDGQLRGVVLDGAGRLFCTRTSRDAMTGRDRSELLRLEPDGRESLRLTLPGNTAPALVTGDRLVLEDDSVRSAADGRELEPPEPGRWWPGRFSGVAEPSGARFRLAESQLDDLPPTIALTRTEQGTRRVVTTWTLEAASGLHLTAQGDALVVTAQRDSRSGTMRDTRLRQVHPRGVEVMSCALVDEVDLEPGGAEQPLQFEADVAFSGRWLAVRTVPFECPACAVGLWAPPRLAFYDLGPTAPGLASSGWVGPRGTPGGSRRSR